MKRIVVLFHDRGTPASRYVVDDLADCWREDGHEVVYLYGTKTFVPADLLLIHVDLSVVPEDYFRFASRYPIALNAQVRDIRKSVISSILTDPHDTWRGPVIVKSDLNYGGGPERVLASSGLGENFHARRLVSRVLTRLSGRAEFNSWTKYRVFDSIDEVPRSIFRRRDVIVERFLPECENNLFYLRMYQMLGDRWTCTRIGSPKPVFKASTSVSSEAIEPHPEVKKWRKQFNLDYGKIDYVVNNGRPVILDVNKTTGASLAVSDARVRAMRRHLAEGLYSYFA